MRSERSRIPFFFFSFLLVFTKSRVFNDNFQKKKSVVFMSSRRRRTRTEKRRAYPLFSSSATKRFLQLALCGERDDANGDRRMR
jgi:hypothetical protein